MVALTVFVIGLAGQQVPSELAALAAKAKLSGAASAWCRAEFRSGHRGAFAAAMSSADGGGRYVALDSDGRVSELSTYKDSADLACYTPADARKLDAAIRKSETIQGRIRPRWKTTVVCGFVDPTAAVCWQYSPADRTFVRVGEWVT
jgi:hypothetical protein